MNLLGITDVIFAHSFPCVHKSSHFMISFSSEPADFDEKSEICVELTDADGKVLLKVDSELDLTRLSSQDRAIARHLNHRHILHDMQIPAPGTYQFNVRVNGRHVHSCPFEAVQLPTPR